MTNPDESEPIDKQIDTYLTNRRGRSLQEAKIAELDHVVEDEKTAASRSRKERQLIEEGKINPIKGEEGIMSDNKAIEDAAAVAAEAVAAGVDVPGAIELGSSKKRIAVIKPEPATEAPTEGGWSVMDGKPMKDPEGEYTFSQALKVAALEKAKAGDEPTFFKWLKDEGLLAGGKGDEFMDTFMKELAQKSVASIVSPPSSGESSSIDALRADMQTLRNELRIATDPVESAKRVKDLFDTFKSLELIPSSTGGTSLEVTKETHRHIERMKDIEGETDYKKNIAETLSGIPERIGHGIGSQYTGEESGGGNNLEYKTCDCGFRIPIPSGIKKVICPKCNAVYDQTETSLPKQES